MNSNDSPQDLSIESYTRASSASSTSDSGLSFNEMFSTPPDTPNSCSRGSQQFWPLIMHNGQLMHLVPNPLVPLQKLPPLPAIESLIVGWAPLETVNAESNFFSNPQLWPFEPVQAVPSFELAAQTMLKIAEHQQFAAQRKADSNQSHLMQTNMPAFPDQKYHKLKKTKTSQAQPNYSANKKASFLAEPSNEGLKMLADLAIAGESLTDSQ